MVGFCGKFFSHFVGGLMTNQPNSDAAKRDFLQKLYGRKSSCMQYCGRTQTTACTNGVLAQSGVEPLHVYALDLGPVADESSPALSEP